MLVSTIYIRLCHVHKLSIDTFSESWSCGDTDCEVILTSSFSDMHVSCHTSTDKQGRSQALYTAPCNGIVSHGAESGCLLVFPPCTQKQTQNQCAHDLCPPCGVLRVFYLRAQTAVDAGDIPTWRTVVILIMGKTWKPPIWAPCWGKNNTGYGISLVHLCIPLKCCTCHFISLFRLLLEIIYFVLDVRIWNSTPSHYPIVGLRDIPLPAWILAFVWPLVCLTVCEIIKIFEIR